MGLALDNGLFRGQLTDWAGHHVDIAHWGLGLDTNGPVEVEGKENIPRMEYTTPPMSMSLSVLMKTASR